MMCGRVSADGRCSGHTACSLCFQDYSLRVPPHSCLGGDKIETRSRCYIFRKRALAACEPKTYEILLPREQLNKSIFLRALRIREIIYLLHYPHGLGAFGHPAISDLKELSGLNRNVPLSS